MWFAQSALGGDAVEHADSAKSGEASTVEGETGPSYVPVAPDFDQIDCDALPRQTDRGAHPAAAADYERSFDASHRSALASRHVSVDLSQAACAGVADLASRDKSGDTRAVGLETGQRCERVDDGVLKGHVLLSREMEPESAFPGQALYDPEAAIAGREPVRWPVFGIHGVGLTERAGAWNELAMEAAVRRRRVGRRLDELAHSDLEKAEALPGGDRE
jgi:hypothetical protein